MAKKFLVLICVLTGLSLVAACSSGDDTADPTTSTTADPSDAGSDESAADTTETTEGAAEESAPESTIKPLDGSFVCGLYAPVFIDRTFGIVASTGVPSEHACAFSFQAADGSAQTLEIADASPEIGGRSGEAGIDAFVEGVDGTSTPFSGTSSGAIVTSGTGDVIGLVLFGNRVLSVTTTDPATEAKLAESLAALPKP